MRRKWIQITLAVGMILLPIAIWWRAGALPSRITIATGPGSGLYREIMEDLARALERRGIEVVRRPTDGSVENLRLLEAETVDLALYQAGTLDFVASRVLDLCDLNHNNKLEEKEFRIPVAYANDPHFRDLVGARRFRDLRRDGENTLDLDEFIDMPGAIRFIANTHYDVAHLIVTPKIADREIEDVGQLIDLARDPRLEKKLTISVGPNESGDYAASHILFRSLGLSGHVIERNLRYSELLKEFRSGRLDGALIMTGDLAEILGTLLSEGKLRLLEIPHAQAIARRHVLVEPYEIPSGLYRSEPDPIPPSPLTTIALRAQLLTRDNVSRAVAEEVTGIVRRLAFVKKNRLSDLFGGGNGFATKDPEFPLHGGARKAYDPRWHPWISTEFVESTEGIRSFIASFIIAAFFGYRWLRERRKKRSEHRLDRYIRSLLEIERRQIPMDRTAVGDDVQTLQDLLDEVTLLRQEALREMSTHDLSEDRGGACFIDMCHELSQKINAKLTRQSLARQFSELTEAVSGRGSSAEESGHQQS